MKVTFTRDELKEMVAHKLGLKVNDFTLVIGLGVGFSKFSKIPMLNTLVKRLTDIGAFAPEGMNRVFLPEKKIETIRAVRTFYYDNGYVCGLSAGKAIVEEWDNFVMKCGTIKGFITNPDVFPWRQ
jgi:hypothetical protein